MDVQTLRTYGAIFEQSPCSSMEKAAPTKERGYKKEQG